MTQMDTKNRRIVLLINPAFQGRFIANIILLNVGVCAIFYSSQNYFFWKVTKIGTQMNLSADHVFFKFIQEQQQAMSMMFYVTSVIVSLIVGIFGLVYSHRIAGPLHHLNKYLRGKAVGSSNYVLKFRDGDYFEELADATNICLGQKSDDKATGT